MKAALRHLTAAAGLALAAPVAAQIALEPGVNTQFEMPGQSFVNAFYVDVPPGAGAMRIELESIGGDIDLDLLLRRDSSLVLEGGVADVQQLFEQAQLLSGSPTGSEYVVIDDGSIPPLGEGRWYIGVLNFSPTDGVAQLTALTAAAAPVVPIEVDYGMAEADCDIGPWSDPARRAAMDRAAELLTQQLQPRAPIRVQACWGDGEDGVLAFAGSNYLFAHDYGFDADDDGQADASSSRPYLPERYTLYSSAATVERAGTSLCRLSGMPCNSVDIRATFVTDANFYYGLDGNPPSGQSDFISTAMHEITHGLGFYGLVDVETGQRFSRYRDPFDAQATYTPFNAPSRNLLEMTDAERLEAVTSNRLAFTGPNLRAANGGASAKLYAPGTPNPGSSLSHFDTLTLRNELMAHQISASAPHDLGLAVGVLYDVGWDPAPKAEPDFVIPPGTQLYDPERSGHGITFYPIAGVPDLYFAVFYTYDASGAPEFYISSGRVVDGVFMPAINAHGDSLVRTFYQPGTGPINDDSAAFDGQLRIDFNDPELSPVCADEAAAAGGTLPTLSAVATYTLGSDVLQQWCVQQVVDVTTNRPEVDLTNLFYDEADGGWGISTLSFDAGATDGIALQIYYPDANGYPRWATGQITDFDPDAAETTIDLYQVRGFCRTCPRPAELTSVPVGTITLRLDGPSQAGATHSVSIDLTYDGAPGGTFQRDTSVIASAVPND